MGHSGHYKNKHSYKYGNYSFVESSEARILHFAFTRQFTYEILLVASQDGWCAKVIRGIRGGETAEMAYSSKYIYVLADRNYVNIYVYGILV